MLRDMRYVRILQRADAALGGCWGQQQSALALPAYSIHVVLIALLCRERDPAFGANQLGLAGLPCRPMDAPEPVAYVYLEDSYLCHINAHSQLQHVRERTALASASSSAMI